MLTQRIKNVFTITVDGAELTKARNIRIYIGQHELLLKYTAEVIDDTHILVTIPYEDAMKLKPHDVCIQLVFTDNNNNVIKLEQQHVPTGAFLDKEGYDA